MDGFGMERQLTGKKRLQLFLAGAALTLAVFSAPALAEGDAMTVFVNGIQLTVPITVFAEQSYYPAEELARALGASFSQNAAGYCLNGTPVAVPPLVLGNKAFFTLDQAVKALGAQMTRDPVRGRVDVVCQTQTSVGGIPFYSKEYRTPEQLADEERRKAENLSTSNLGSWIRDNNGKFKDMMPKQTPLLDRVYEFPSDLKVPSHPWLKEEDDSNLMNDGRPVASHSDHAAGPPPFMARTCQNDLYRVLVSDAKLTESLPGISPGLVAPSGTKYLVVQLTQENISKTSLPSAWFGVRDLAGNQFLADYSLSQFNRSPLRGGEATRGYVIFQLPAASQPTTLEILCTPTLSVILTR
jgi:hypothetical protein